MRPYLAIIRDSFREALASRVLWLLFVLITLLLAVLAPLGYRQTITRGLNDDSVENWPQFIELIRDESAKAALSPSRRLVSLFDEATKKKIAEFKIPEPNDTSNGFKFLRTLNEIRQAINQQLEKRELYDEKYWNKTPLVSEEARRLAKKGVDKLSDDDVARFNRLLMESSYPDAVSPSPPTSVRFRYLWYDVGEPLPIRKSELTRSMEGIIRWILDWFVGGAGILGAISITAPFIPQTFDPGVLNLLLSKPIRRSFLFIAKFIGGCIFVTLNVTYLICGFCLIIGWRFEIWDAKLLLFIPVYVFVFMIFYSVSALAGLIWRNAIISIALSSLFWFCCFSVGTTKVLTEQMILNKLRIVNLLPVESDLIAVNEFGATFLWDQAASDWREIFVPTGEEETQRRMAMALLPSVPTELRPIGPVYDASNQQLISASRSMRNGQMMLNIGRRSEQWKNVKGTNASLGTVSLLCEPDGKILTISSLGIYRLVGDPTAKPEPVKVFGFSLPLPSAGPFESVGPEAGFIVARPVDAKINPESGLMAIFSRGTITLLEKNASGRYEILRSKELKLESNRSAVLGFGGATLLVGHEDGRIVVLDPTTIEGFKEFTDDGRTMAIDPANLEERSSFTPVGNNPPRFVTASPQGRYFAIVFHNGDLWTYDTQRHEMKEAPVADQGDISSAVFSAPDRLLVAHHTTRVSEYDINTWKRIAYHAPSMSLSELVYRYGIAPLYYVFPKPGELDKTVQYILTGKETVQTGPGRSDLTVAQQNLHPWRPVVSSLVFMLVVLGLGCLYIERQEF